MKDPYVYPGTNVLINLAGIKDQDELSKYENGVVLDRIEELREKPLKGKFDKAHLQATHKHLFQDVYPSAGKATPPFSGAIRIVGIEKDNGIDYPHPQDSPLHNLNARLDYAFDRLKKDDLTNTKNQQEFTRKLTKHSAELWECHPFRDGNTRTTFIFSESIAKTAGFEFKRDQALVSNFRKAIADYARGDRDQFVQLMAELVVPGKELEKPKEISAQAEYTAKFKVPISVNEYDKAIKVIKEQRNEVRNELFPDMPITQSLDSSAKSKINNRVKKRAPLAIETKNAFEAQKTVSSLLSELKTADGQVKQARENGDDKSEKRLSKKISNTLQKLVYRESLAKQLSPEQRKMFKGVRKELTKTLSLEKSKGISL